MSSNYRVNLIWASHGEQLRADLNALQNKITSVGKTTGQSNRQMGQWGQTMRALGTTIRYAFAGSIIYGVATAITSLGDFENKLGEIDALAATFKDGNIVGLGDELEKLGDHALSLSNKWGVAVGDIQTQMRAFFSSGFPTSTRNQAGPWADVLAQVSLITEGADPAKMAIGIAGLTQSQGRGKNPAAAAANYRDMISQVLKGSTAFRGEDIARDIGRLSSAGTAMAMTPEQVFAVYGTAGLVGGSGSVIGRGVSQLLSASLINPKTKQQKAAFAQLGLPTDPESLRKMGGLKVLEKMLRGVGTLSRGGKVGLGNEGLTDEEAVAQAGGNRSHIDLLFKAIGRMESVRQMLSLMAVGGPDAIEKFLASIHEAERVHQGAQQAEKINSRRYIQQMSEAQKNLRMQIIRGFAPALKELTKGMKWLSDRSIGHPAASAGIVVGGVAASILARRFFMSQAATGLLSKLPGGLGKGVGRAGQLSAAAAIGAGPIGAFASSGKGTHSDPIWVVIDPLSWFMPGAPGSSTSGPGGGPTVIGTGRGMPKLSRGARLARATGWAGAALILADMFTDPNQRKSLKSGHDWTDALTHPWSMFAGDAGTIAGWLGGGGKGDKFSQLMRAKKAQKLHASTLPWHVGDPRHFNELPALPGGLNAIFLSALNRHRPSGAGEGAKIHGEATLQIDLEPTGALKDIVKPTRGHATVKLKPGSTSGARPTHKGKKTTQRGAAAQ